jgi:hypothetical protein
MGKLLHLVHKLPLSRTRLSWERELLDSAYARDIAAARAAKDQEKAQSLISAHQFELELHGEEEDAYLTRKLLSEARRLWIPEPPLFINLLPSEHWYQSQNSGRWYLTRQKGMTALREAIRTEGKAAHEARSRWVVWITATTGLIGAVTGLVAVLTRH